MIMLAALALAQATPAPPPLTVREPVTMVGAGAQMCRTWSRHSAGSMVRMNDIQWAQGFFSGANLQAVLGGARSVLAPTEDMTALVTRIDDYCRAHPDNHVSEGAQEIWQELVARPRT